jgi:nucleotide-binding universal stress UspA family protein
VTGPVVCGVDFSDHSMRSLAWARFLATTLDQPLIIVHAIEPLLAEAASLTYGADTLQTSLTADLEALADGATVDVATGQPARVLAGAALAANASAVVVGTQGLGRAARMWFGSTTMRLLRESTIPILAVPARAQAEPSCAGIVLGTDFSPASTAAREVALSLGARARVPITCVHVVPAVPPHARWNDVVAGAADSVLRAARTRLEEEESAAAIPASAQWTATVRTGEPAEVLIDAAAGGSTLVVVGLGGASVAQRPGTTAYRVVSEADGPVLAVPARA